MRGPAGHPNLARSSKGTSPMRFLRFLPAALLAGFLSLHGAAAAHAATVAPFTEQAFKSAQSDGQPILVDISATWCPTCAQQKPIIDSLAATPAFAKLVILHGQN